ncbi:MAG: 30S ribosomal protein S18 [Candidatus Omnitrophica bacterium]|nr:30S ribosomal protein S18 [Candidatus Omnitrophota bacterium]
MKVKTRGFAKTKKTDKKRLTIVRKKFCRLCLDKTKAIDYKDAKRLEAFINERGKIVPSRNSGNCAKHQRRVAETIAKARFVSLLPYTR